MLKQRGDMAVGGEDDLDGLSSQLGGLSLQIGSDTREEEQGSPPSAQSFMEVFQSSFISTRVSRGGHYVCTHIHLHCYSSSHVLIPLGSTG